MANINKIRVSGITYDIQDINAPKVIELTQAEYDALTVKDPNIFYVITDSEYNFDGYWTSAQTQSAITQSVNGKADTSAVTSVSDSLTAHTADTTIHVTAQDKTNWNAKSDFSGSYNDLTNKLSAGTNISIVDNVISAEGSGGKAVSGGTNISVTTGTTADTINCTLPIKSEVNNTSIYFGTDNWGSASGGRNLRIGYNANAFGDDAICLATNSTTNGSSSFIAGGRNNKINGNYDFIGAGLKNITNNDIEAAFGYFNNSIKTTSGWFPYSSGNTLFSVGNGTAENARHNAFEIRQNGDIYLNDGSKLQDTVSATTANTTALGGLKLVKLTQSEYDNLPTKDNSTLYVIVN